jgi:ABC-type multidrug transport system fused ATPase/permease subunit
MFLDELRKCISLISKAERNKISLLIASQLALAVLDLLGVALFGILAVISISGIKSSSLGSGISRILEILQLNNSSLEFQVSVLAFGALVLLIVKTALTYLISRKILVFLSLRSAKTSSKLLEQLLSTRLLIEQGKTQQEILYSITGGVNLIIVGVLGSFASFIADAFSLLILALGLFVYNPLMTLFCGAYFFLIGWINYKALHKKIVKQSEITTELSIQSNETTLELINAYRELFLSGNSGYYLNRFSIERSGIAKASAALAIFPNVSKYIVEVSMLVGILSMAGFQFLSLDAVQAVGAISIFLAASTRIAPALLRLQQNIFSMKGNMAASKQSLELVTDLKREFDREEIVVADVKRSDSNSLVEFRNVSFEYKKDHRFSLNNLNFSISKGQKVAIVGPSGSGKSTVLDLFLALQIPDHGSVFIDGINPQRYIKNNPGKIGFVPQSTKIVNDTLVRNIALGVSSELIDMDRISYLVKVLDLVDLQDIETSTTRLGDGGGRLSGGQKQRIGIARALYPTPEILVMDEATSALDSISENKISELLKRVSSDVTVISVAHRLSTVVNSDLVLYFDSGSLVATGTFNEIRIKVPNFDQQAKLMGL